MSFLYIANAKALNYYDLVTTSEGNNILGLSLKYGPIHYQKLIESKGQGSM